MTRILPAAAVVLFTAIVLTALVLVGCSGGPKVGSKAPGFPGGTALDSDGGSGPLDDYHGKTVVLYFWAVWCPPCVTSGPEIQKLHEEFDPRDVAVVGVHFDDDGDPSSYMAEHGYTFGLITNGKSMVNAYGIDKIPQILVIGRDGTVLHRQIGFAEGDGKQIAALLADQS